MKKILTTTVMFLSLVSYATPSKVTVRGTISTGESALNIAKSSLLDQSEAGKMLTYDECLLKYNSFLSVIQETIRMNAITKMVNACNSQGGKIVLNSIVAGKASAAGSGSYIASSVDLDGDNRQDKFTYREGKNAITELAPHTSNYPVGQHMMQMCTTGVSFDQYIKNWTNDRADFFNYWKQGHDFVGGLGAMNQEFFADCN